MFKRRRRNGDMLMLGGWLFADLLLGLAMIFLASNTFGESAPAPTPTATPNLLATSQAQVDSARATVVAQANIAELIAQQQTATAIAEQTREAMSESERATADAQSTEQALAAQATMAAFATQIAESEAVAVDLQTSLEAAAAQATADAQSAQATIEALATQQSEQATVAAQNSESGANAAATANAQATALAEIAAVATQNAESGANDLATAEAALATAQAAVAGQDPDALATAQAEADQLQSTVVALATQVALLQEGTAIEQNAVTLTISTTGNNISDELDDVLQPYQSCQAVVVLVYGHANDIGPGQDLAREVIGVLQDDFSSIFDGAAMTDLADTSGGTGDVDLVIYFVRGCVPSE
ncbi:hypothetical protein BH09CHL1_BH09CHL1_29940 [soil metagenome]